MDLAGIGFLAAMVAIFVGVVMFVFNREAPDTSNLTELHSAQVLDLTDIGSSYRVVYEYKSSIRPSTGKRRSVPRV